MTGRTKAPRTYYASHSRQELAIAMKMDNPDWLLSTPIQGFSQKFGFTNASHRTEEEIGVIYELSQKINGPESCREVLSAIGGMLKGMTDKLGEIAPRLIKGEKALPSKT